MTVILMRWWVKLDLICSDSEGYDELTDDDREINTTKLDLKERKSKIEL